ncbi:family 43 glycosylhydrolase [Piscinibacter gummiphilus]|nr:family 43 glycosylhydrolase [Piscinibacter gummiphilus]GLS93471.1 glycosyl hydrolase family 43 [Piscinibacter gummiphilus]
MTWLDISGKPIAIHGGSVIQEGDTFFWYGENKERTTGKDDIWHWGVKCYSSKDLYHWEDRGVIIAPEPEDRSSPLHPARMMDRPHIVFNAKTRKYVCWIKVMGETAQTRSVLTADSLLGPYELVRRDQLPLGMSAGDFDLVVDSITGRGTMVFERVHSDMICADLTDDYTDFTGHHSAHFPRPGVPSVREAPAHFHRQGKHYLLTSGTTHYFPNPSEAAVAENIHGPWTELGDLHPTDVTRTSFNSQISSVFKHPGKRDLYIAIADRWLTLEGAEFESGELSARVWSIFEKAFAVPKQELSDEDKQLAHTLFAAVDTSKSGHVWLPLRFDGDRPRIEWRSEWSLEEFE